MNYHQIKFLKIMKTINEELLEFYNGKQINLDEISKFSDENNQELDGPCLIHCWDELYSKAKYKILFVGKWTNGFLQEASTNVSECVKYSKDLIEGVASRDKESSFFFRSIKKIAYALNPELEKQPCFLWTNIIKYSRIDGRKISDQAKDFIHKRLNILENEIAISKPDVVIFFTGHALDKILINQFKNEVRFDTIDGFDLKEIAQISHRLLPENTYRVCHPQYDDYSEIILNLIRKSSMSVID
jgi:hypothetical protein